MSVGHICLCFELFTYSAPEFMELLVFFILISMSSWWTNQFRQFSVMLGTNSFSISLPAFTLLNDFCLLLPQIMISNVIKHIPLQFIEVVLKLACIRSIWNSYNKWRFQEKKKPTLCWLNKRIEKLSFFFHALK